MRCHNKHSYVLTHKYTLLQSVPNMCVRQPLLDQDKEQVSLLVCTVQKSQMVIRYRYNYKLLQKLSREGELQLNHREIYMSQFNVSHQFLVVSFP